VRDAKIRISNARSYAGTLVHRARNFIYNLGYGVTSAAVERVLMAESWVPTPVSISYSDYTIETSLICLCQNTFAEKLGCFGFDHFIMLVVDLLHEFELGVWKAIFTHLIRLLHAAGSGGRLVAKLNMRSG
jgi:hypothetical protein